MSQHWLVEYALQAIGWAYVILVGIGVLFAAVLPKKVLSKVIALVVVLALASIPLVQGYAQYERNRNEEEDTRQRLRAAEKLFEERCLQAGERINRTVDHVTGVLLINLREFETSNEQFAASDPAGDSAKRDGYIQTFLQGRDRSTEHPFLLSYTNRDGAYKFVEAPGEEGETIRYVDERIASQGLLSATGLLTAYRGKSRQSRYGVTWDDISTREDRTNWIAGNRIRVVDLQSGDVLAERVGYILDKGQGSKTGERQPWRFAQYNACPQFPQLHDRYPHAYGLTRNFVEKVLKP